MRTASVCAKATVCARTVSVTEGPVRPGDIDAARRRVAHRAAAERWPLLRLAGRDGQKASSTDLRKIPVHKRATVEHICERVQVVVTRGQVMRTV